MPLSEAVLPVLHYFGHSGWEEAVAAFTAQYGSLTIIYGGHRASQGTVAIKLRDGKEVHLSPGIHNELEKAIVEDFGPRFAPGAELLYVGDTADKGLLMDIEGLAEIGFPISEHDKLPDIVFYQGAKNWLYLVGR